MMPVGTARTLPADWYPGTIPANVAWDPTAYVGTSYSFIRFQSQQPAGVRIGRGASLCDGAVLDVGSNGRVTIGDYAIVTETARIICDGEIVIGDYALIAWSALLMDTYRWSFDAADRARVLVQPARERPPLAAGATPRPIRIGANAWIGFEACVLPGVVVGEGAIVGARSVVTENVPPYAVAAGNPARVLRRR
jgi:acetyltransferase-like isoleucine patch superfamily enzyme